MKSAYKKSARKSRRTKALNVVAPRLRQLRVLVRRADGLHVMSRFDRRRNIPVVAAIQWVEQHADGFNRLALLIDAADYMNERRHVDPEAANHVAIGLTMMRDELRNLRKRLWV